MFALRVETPLDTKHEVSTLEGRATATVSWKSADRFNQFYIDLAMRDQDAGVIHVAVRGARTPGSAVLDECDMRVGEATRTSTVPSFVCQHCESTGLLVAAFATRVTETE